jgi:hypothetical protein
LVKRNCLVKIFCLLCVCFWHQRVINSNTSKPEALEAEADWRPERQEPKCPAHNSLSSWCLFVKDGLREVPKGDNWPRTLLLSRKCLLAPERHLCPRAIKKGYKNPISKLTTSFGSRCMPPFSLSLLFSTNKIFLTSAAWVHPLLSFSEQTQEPSTAENSCLSSVYHLCTQRTASQYGPGEKKDLKGLSWKLLENLPTCDSQSNTPGICTGEMNMYCVYGNV